MSEDIQLLPSEKYSDLRGRTEFGKLLETLGLTGEGVEVGTHRGEFAKVLLETSPLSLLHCVDNYSNDYDPTDPTCREDRSPDLREAIRTLTCLEKPVKFHLMDSKEAAQSFQNHSVDFVYLDACHQEWAVREDIRLWWPKVRPGGVLAGHDIICPGAKARDGLGWGKYIRPVVNEFAKENNLTVYIVKDSRSYWSWYVIKPDSK